MVVALGGMVMGPAELYPPTAVPCGWPGLLPLPPPTGSPQVPAAEAAAVREWGSVDALGDGGSTVPCPRRGLWQELWQTQTRLPGPLVVRGQHRALELLPLLLLVARFVQHAQQWLYVGETIAK